MPQAILSTDTATGTRHARKVRQTWLIEVRATLEAFDRLTAKGLSGRKAAKRLGLRFQAITTMRNSTASLEDAFRVWTRSAA